MKYSRLGLFPFSRRLLMFFILPLFMFCYTAVRSVLLGAKRGVVQRVGHCRRFAPANWRGRNICGTMWSMES